MADSSTSSVSIESINSLIGTTTSNRVSGLASGIDVDSIVAKLMTAESQPLVQMQQNLQQTEWQRDDYRSMNTLLSALQSSTQTMKLQGTYLSKTVSSSNSSLVTATAGATAGNATYSLSNITMAKSAYNNSSSAIAKKSDFDPSQSMWDLVSSGAFSNGLNWNVNEVNNETQTVSSEGTTFSLKHAYINNKSSLTTGSITVNTSDGSSSTPFQVVTDPDEFKSDGSLGAQVLLDRETGKLTFNQELSKGSTISVPKYTYDTINFSITTTGTDGTTKNTKDFSFDPSASFNSILTSITQSSVGVSAFYDPGTQKVSLTRTETGDMNAGMAKDGYAEIEFDDDFLTKTLQLNKENETDGNDATFTINGLASHSHSNTLVLGGVTFNLQGNSVDPVTLKVTNDTDSVYKSISDFVDKYNDTIKQINDKISETRNRDYSPLTDAQKSGMSDSDITNWTDKARSGMLSNDSILSSALSQLRMNLYSPVSGASNSKMDQLAEIGITTSTDYLDKGKLVIDEDKLKEALSTNPQAVMELFTKTGDTTSEQGIMQRLNTTLKNTMDQIEDKAGNTNMVYTQYSMGKSIDDMNDRIDAFKLRLQSIQTRYYNQFSSMEAAIEQANSQATYLSQFISS